MIKTSKQLKDLIHNRTKGESGKSQLLFRNYAMERFLERIALSPYNNNFILKGGLLISSIVGLDNRATMDIDATIRNLPIESEHMRRIIEEIMAVEIDDNMCFEIKDVSGIMDDAEYGGIRFSLDAYLDKTRIPLKIDISTGDIITPSEITYQYKLMFEQRMISLNAYPLETIIAEKIETILIRTIFNTRLRDYYDLFILQQNDTEIDIKTLAEALTATCRKRKSEQVLSDYQRILDDIEQSLVIRNFWECYQSKNSYAAGITWSELMSCIRSICDKCVSHYRGITD